MATAITLSTADGAVARIAPELGFNCYEFACNHNGETVEILDFPEDYLSGKSRPSGYGTPLLFPFPNRIRGGKYTWDGKEYAIPLPQGSPNAIHGFCLNRPWRVVSQTATSLTGEFQMTRDDPERAPYWPADFILQIEYALSGRSGNLLSQLTSRIRVTNPDNRPLPWGFGTHPYFRVPLSRGSMPANCRYGASVRARLELVDFLPSGKTDETMTRQLQQGVTFGSARFDDVFTQWEAVGEERISWLVDDHADLRVNYVADAEYFRELVVYTPPNRHAFCLEPYTCWTDAINLQQQGFDAGLRVLAPGETVETWLRLDVGKDSKG